MLRIGEFSMLSKISIHMLRNYDAMGLITPAHIDGFTGYRYYSENQLPIANKVQALKDMGLSLSDIKKVLEKHDNNELLKEYLFDLTAQKKEEIHKLEKQLLLVKNAINCLKNGSNLSSSIAIKEIPSRKVISYRNKIKGYNQEGVLWQQMYEEARLNNIEYDSPAYIIAIFHNQKYEEYQIDVEVQRTVKCKFKDTENLKFKFVNSILVATITVKGGYSQLFQVNQAIAEWITNNNYKLNGPPFNIYHVSFETQSNIEELITEICFPIKNKS
ncbi:MerR family transcriptional regulator [Clostridium sp. CTA-19]